jgi:hypothetical protein
VPWGSRARSFLRRAFHRDRVEQELDEEVRAYFEIVAERGRARGLSETNARRAERLRFEGPEQVKHRVREVRVGASIETAVQDIRYAWRLLAKSPGFTFFAVMTIALGLGANAAIFTMVDGVLLKSTGYPDAGRIVQLWEKPPVGERNSMAAANYIDWASQAHSFESMAAVSGASMAITGTGEPKSMHVGMVSAPYFDVYGVKATLGRTFFRDEDQPGKVKVVVLAKAAPVIVSARPLSPARR